MHLSFDSTGELLDFLEFARTVGGLFPPRDEPVAGSVADAARTAASIEFLTRTASGPLVEPDYSEGAPAEAEAPKRKRRTKAEMEAAANPTGALVAAEAGTQTGAAEATASTVTVVAQPASDNPFAAQPSANMQAILAAPDQKSAMAAAATAMQTPPVDKTDAQLWIRSRAAEIGEMDALTHLGKARGFIAKHQMAKYNETFNLAGLQPNVMAYTPADCALHAAAMDFCEA